MKSFRTRPAFSLIELLVVIAIIGIVIAIVVPALGGARKAAKKADTQNLVTNLNQASAQFVLNERRTPGYFTPREMGSAENEARGLTGMQNAMLDLAGGLLPAGAAQQAGDLDVGPTAASEVVVRPDLIGVTVGNSAAYFKVSEKNYRPQDGTQGGNSNAQHADHRQLPDIVDSFGTPVLFWAQDPSATQPIDGIGDFARQAATQPSRFYWNSNAAYLADGSNRIGTQNIQMADASLMGENNINRMDSVMALLGNPSSPQSTADTIPTNQIYPSAARGSYVIHSAGQNGVYIGRSERGGTLAAQSANALYYGYHFRTGPAGTDVRTDRDGKATSVDMIATEFDDLVQSGG